MPLKKNGSLRTYVPKGARSAAASLRGRKSRIDRALELAAGKSTKKKKKARKKY